MLEGSQPSSAFRLHVAGRLGERSVELTVAWLDELRARLPEHPQRIFPDDTLFNHVPALLRRLFAALVGGERITADDILRAELEKLGTLRRAQGYHLDEVLAEFEILRRIVYEALIEESRTFAQQTDAGEPLQVARDVEYLLGDMVQVTSQLYRRREQASRRKRGELLLDYGRAVTHELRNRLNAARLTLRVYRESEEPDPTLLDSLERTLDRIDRVADDAFTVAIAQRYNAEGAADMRPLNDVVAEIVADLQELAAKRCVELRMPAELPHFPVDSTRVGLVLLNLLTNAIKYSDPSREQSWVELGVARTREPRTWRVEVADNGMGIPETLHETVFEEYVRAPGTKGTDGDGLGLALSREAVEQLGGRLWLSSEVGRGSCFTFTLEEPSEALDV